MLTTWWLGMQGQQSLSLHKRLPAMQYKLSQKELMSWCSTVMQQYHTHLELVSHGAVDEQKACCMQGHKAVTKQYIS